MTGNPRHRVLHLISSDQRRGAQVFAAQLARNLPRKYFESALCILSTTADGGLPADSVRTFLLDVASERKQSQSARELSVLWRLYKVLREFQPDILVAHGATTLRYGALSRLFYRNSVNVYRNIGMAGFWSRSWLKVQFNRFFLGRFDKVVSSSVVSRKDFLRVYRIAPERVALIPNARDITPYANVDSQRLRIEYRRGLGFDRNDAVLINVGSLSPEKNQEQLLLLICELRESDLPVRLLLVGDGPLRNALEEKTRRLGVVNRVHFLGVRDDIPALLAVADIFVLPSKTELMPAVVIEAGLAGLACVAYSVGGLEEVIENGVTGMLIREGDYTSFKKAVLHLLRDTGRREALGTAARRHCRERFDMGKVAKKYGQLFLTLLDKHKRGDIGAANEDSLAH